ncbi:hypothetical protein B484DRAFT_282093 [Ochromonadaceae sp. CCMP2298]|nr:hypothetical protein B484DRAFT_282093 [Ochromonadaceae sp. CCMP2298]
MLVGTCPFKGSNEGDLLMNIKTKELVVPKEVVISKTSVDILIKLLERHPGRRASLPQLLAATAHLSNSLMPRLTPTAEEPLAGEAGGMGVGMGGGGMGASDGRRHSSSSQGGMVGAGVSGGAGGELGSPDARSSRRHSASATADVLMGQGHGAGHARARAAGTGAWRGDRGRAGLSVWGLRWLWCTAGH